ncbi:MAG: hypothetical protein SF002_13210 [Alphaproteobacteria bacterium]|nr:hypothetical protein [Alphaproteobacteria bacterium]
MWFRTDLASGDDLRRVTALAEAMDASPALAGFMGVVLLQEAKARPPVTLYSRFDYRLAGFWPVWEACAPPPTDGLVVVLERRAS